MAATRVLPYREADARAVDWGQWWLMLGRERRPVEDILTGWDYSTALSFELQPAFDIDLLLESTGLPSADEFEVIVLVECPATARRFIGRRSLSDLESSSEKTVRVEPPLGHIADKVRLSAHLVLARTLSDVGDDVAYRKGSRLAGSERHTVALEGSGARFPTEAAPFSALGLEAALWTLRCDLHDPEEPFTSAVRLMINADHSRSEALLDTAHPEHDLLQSALETDIVRQLILTAREGRREFAARRPWPEGSTGEALEQLAELFFGKRIQELLSIVETDYPRFERILQERVGLFRVKA